MGLGSGIVRALALAGAVLLVAAAGTVRQERVEFAQGATTATLEGAVSGFDSVEYQVAAEAGQVMTVGLATEDKSVYFNVYRPGDIPGQSAAVHVGPRSGNDWTQRLRASGDYTVQVFLIRAAARRGDAGAYTLEVAVTGEPSPEAAPPSAGAATRPAAETTAETAAPGADVADALKGGPDFWEVAGVEPGAQLNLRAEPSTRAQAMARFDDGAVLRNLGCRMQGTQRWCQVEPAATPNLKGWVSGRYLKEATPEALKAAGQAGAD
jgi:hypothetical protein